MAKRTQKISLIDNLTRLQLIELDACTRCMACLDWCPVLDVTGDEDLATPEKIRIYGQLIREQHSLTGRLLGPREIDPAVLEHLSEALYTCTTCGRCGEVCSVGINTQRLWPALRAKMVELGAGPIGEQREAIAIVAEKHNPYDEAHDARFNWVPADVQVADQAEIGFFTGCSGAYTSQPMVVGALRGLQASGISFALFDDEWCCGFPLWIIGELELAEQLVVHNVDGFAALGVKELVVSCPCCLNMLQNQWPYFYGKELPFEIIHITQVISRRIRAGDLKPARSLQATVTYHDPCYLSRGVRLTEEPREIISKLPGIRFVEMTDNRELSKCCGSGGGIRRAYPEIALEMARNLLRDAEAVDAEILLLDCPACYERVRLAQQGFDCQVEVMDLMELVASLL